jgi:hypothetical protein
MPKKLSGRSRTAAADSETAGQDAMFEELLGTLSAISGSLGAIALRLAPSRQKLKNQGDQIRYLGKLGHGKKAIAAILATTEATVGSRLTEKKTAKKTAKKTSRAAGRPKARGKR